MSDTFISNQVEAIFVWLRGRSDEIKNPRSEKFSFGRILKNNTNSYFFNQHFLPHFDFSITLISFFLIVFFASGKINGIFLIGYFIIAIFVSLFIASVVTFSFQKHDRYPVEQFSNLSELSDLVKIAKELSDKFDKKKANEKNSIKIASIFIKKTIDSYNDFLTLSSGLLSIGILLIAYGIIFDQFEGKTQDQETISKIFAGLCVGVGLIIRFYGYLRLLTLRKWQTIIDIAEQLETK